jgi:Domain of unknown function (DUF5753)/AAA domain
VENGGGMSLLADALGYARLTEPVRFHAAWEQAASLRLRDGDTSVLAEYDQHGRIAGGDPEQMMDAAAAAYLARSLDGTDTLLMTADHALRRELNRRIREDLITLGVVSGGPAVTIADGTRASPGDLIVCTGNDHGAEAGEPGRTLANGDLLRIEAVTRNGLIVRRALNADPRTGQRRWTDRYYPASFRPFSAYEAGARSLRLFEHVLVPGLLQTADYARAVLSTRPHASADEIEELVTARLARQAVLPRADPPLLYVLLDEGMLHRPVGTPEVMASQVARLAELSEQTLSRSR